MYKQIYIKRKEEELWKEARALSGESFSQTVVLALKEFLDKKKQVQERVTVVIGSEFYPETFYVGTEKTDCSCCAEIHDVIEIHNPKGHYADLCHKCFLKAYPEKRGEI